MSFLPTDHLIISRSRVNDDFKIKLSPLSSQAAEFYAVVKLEIFKKISTSMLAPVTVDTAYFLLDFKSSLCLDKFKDQLFEVFVSTNGDYESQNKIVHIHIMLPERGTLVHKSLSPCWLSSHSTICAHVDLMGDILGMNVLPQEEHTGEIVSCTSTLDACGKLSIMSRSFWSDAKFDNVWERFLSAELISHQAVSDQWMFYDPCKNIDSDTLLAFPTKKFERVEASMDIWWACIDLQWKPRTYFWENEWFKHGQMGLWGQGDTGAESYFLDGIKARQKIDLLQILEKGKIAFNTEYTKKQVVDVLHSSLGVEYVYLAYSPRGKSYVLRELLICLNKTTHLYISCPPDNRPRGCSGTTFQIPVFH